MAFRLLQRVTAGSATSNPAAAAAAAAATLGLGATSSFANCDSSQEVIQGVRIVELGDSWENLFRNEDTTKSRSVNSPPASDPAFAAPVSAVERDQFVDADRLSQVNAKLPPGTVSFSLAPPTQEERERALFEVEALLKDGALGATSASSSFDASESMEVSERALLRAKALMGDADSADAYAGTLSQSAPAGGAVWQPVRSVRMQGAGVGALADGTACRAIVQPVFTGGGAGGSGWDMAQQGNIRHQMAQVMDKHKDKVERILSKPAVWAAILNDEDVQDILKEEHATVTAMPKPSPKIEEFDNTQAAAGEGGGGIWSLFTLIQERIEGIVHSVRKFMFQPVEERQGHAYSKPESDKVVGTEDGVGAWGVLGGILAVVVTVAMVVVLQRAKSR